MASPRVPIPLVPAPDHADRAIVLARGQRVILDRTLAVLYGVPTKALVQAVKRNRERFPEDFMFQLTRAGYSDLRSQTVTSRSWGGRRSPPYAFTEQGVAMLSSVLRSKRAVRVNIEIMRAFVRLRRFLVSQEELARKVEALARRYDGQFRAVFDALKNLMAPPEAPRRRIGFRSAAGGPEGAARARHRRKSRECSRVSGRTARLNPSCLLIGSRGGGA